MDAGAIPEPQRRLPGAARWYWGLSIGLRGAVAALVALTVGSELAGEVDLAPWLPVTVVAAVGAAAALVIPEVRWRRWRYEVRDNEIDLRHGLWTTRRTLIPIRRIQHVDTEAGPLQNAFSLAAVDFHTAAGPTRIPALGRYEADMIRRRVGELARTRDDV